MTNLLLQFAEKSVSFPSYDEACAALSQHPGGLLVELGRGPLYPQALITGLRTPLSTEMLQWENEAGKPAYAVRVEGEWRLSGDPAWRGEILSLARRLPSIPRGEVRMLESQEVPTNASRKFWYPFETVNNKGTWPQFLRGEADRWTGSGWEAVYEVRPL